MRIKPGVKLGGLAPEMVIALIVAQEAYERAGYECVVTAATDGKHMAGSLHYRGKGLDLRTKHLPSPETARRVAAEMRDRLGADFDVIVESNHIHVEFDPKPTLPTAA